MLTNYNMVVSQCKMHTICNKNPWPTLNDIACPSLILQLTVALLLHSRNDTRMKTLCQLYEAYLHKFIVWILNVLEGHQFNATPHLTPTMEDLFLGCAKKTRKDYLVSPHTQPKTLAWHNKPTKWCLNVPFTDVVIQVLGCAEERCCIVCPRNLCGIHDMNCPLCPQREMPICASCSDELSRAHPKMPPFALPTKMWIGYINEYIYEHLVTCIELFFASLGDTAMLSATLQRFHDHASGSS